MKKLKFIVISNMYPSADHPSYGVFVRNFEEGIVAQGQHLVGHTVIEGRGSNAFQKLWKYLKFFLGTIYQGLFLKADVLYVHYISHTVLPVLLVSYLSSKKIVLNAHGSDVLSNSKVQGLLLPLVTLMVKRSDALVVPSGYYKHVVMDKFNIGPEKIIVSPSGGIDEQRFYPIRDRSIPTGAFTIGYVSRIDEAKGWEYFLEGASLFRQLYPELKVRLTMAGAGAQVEEMKMLAQKLGLTDVLEYAGMLDQAELCEQFNDMDVFVFPSYREAESLGLVGLEAMACGTPVIASNIGGIPDYQKDGENGYLVEPKNAEAICSSLVGYHQLDDGKKASFSSQALATAHRFSRSSVTEHLLQQLQNVLGS